MGIGPNHSHWFSSDKVDMCASSAAVCWRLSPLVGPDYNSQNSVAQATQDNQMTAAVSRRKEYFRALFHYFHSHNMQCLLAREHMYLPGVIQPVMLDQQHIGLCSVPGLLIAVFCKLIAYFSAHQLCTWLVWGKEWVCSVPIGLVLIIKVRPK